MNGQLTTDDTATNLYWKGAQINPINGIVSTANLANLVSTANLATLVSTTYLATQLGSTVVGLPNVAVTEITAGTNISISATVGPGKGNVTINATSPAVMAGTVMVYASGSTTSIGSITITGLSGSSIVMVTPLDDLTEGGTTLITYSATPTTDTLIIYLTQITYYNGTTIDFFGVMNYNHAFSYFVAQL